jgi:hypothetical protein
MPVSFAREAPRRRLPPQLRSTSGGTQPTFARFPAFSRERGFDPLIGLDSGKLPSPPNRPRPSVQRQAPSRERTDGSIDLSRQPDSSSPLNRSRSCYKNNPTYPLILRSVGLYRPPPAHAVVLSCSTSRRGCAEGLRDRCRRVFRRPRRRDPTGRRRISSGDRMYRRRVPTSRAQPAPAPSTCPFL